MFADHPHARFMYILKSFSLKLVEQWREEVWKEFGRGNVITGGSNAVKKLASLTVFLTAAGMTKDQVLDFIDNRMEKGHEASFGFMPDKKDKEFYDSFTNNVWRATGIFDKFSVGQSLVGKTPVTTLAQKVLLPPAGALDPAVKFTATAGQDLYGRMNPNAEVDVDYEFLPFLKFVTFIGRSWESHLKAANKEREAIYGKEYVKESN